MRFLGGVTSAALALVLAAPPATSGAADTGPALRVPVEKLRAALRCPPEFAGSKDPVLFVHGLTQTGLSAWSWNYDKALAADGYDPCLVSLPEFATTDIQLSTEYVVQAVRDLAERSESGKVDVVTFSKGALEARWAMTWWPDLRDKVDDAVLLAAPNNGSSAAELTCGRSCVAAVWQSRPGAGFLGALNDGDQTPGSASYTNVFSDTDELVFMLGEDDPSSASAAVDGATNIRVQDLCPGRPVEHLQHVYDAQVYRLVVDALEHPGPAQAARAGRACGQVTMPGVELYDAAAQSAATFANFAARTSENKVDAEPPVAEYARR